MSDKKGVRLCQKNANKYNIDYTIPEELEKRLRTYQLRTLDMEDFKDGIMVELREKARLIGDDLDVDGTARIACGVGVGRDAPDAGMHVAGGVVMENDMEIKGKLTVRGDVIAKDEDHMPGNVRLGDQDEDTITINGTLKSEHSSGKLEMNDELHVSEGLSVDGSTQLIDVDADNVNITGSVTSGHGSGKLEVNDEVRVSENLQVDGSVTAQGFSGDGESLTGMNAGNISSGILDSERIPGLSADKLSSGVLNTKRIPGLNADKISSGTLVIDRIPADSNENLGGRDDVVPTQKAVKAYVDNNTVKTEGGFFKICEFTESIEKDSKSESAFAHKNFSDDERRGGFAKRLEKDAKVVSASMDTDISTEEWEAAIIGFKGEAMISIYPEKCEATNKWRIDCKLIRRRKNPTITVKVMFIKKGFCG